jgi:hypothetical protein
VINLGEGQSAFLKAMCGEEKKTKQDKKKKKKPVLQFHHPQ